MKNRIMVLRLSALILLLGGLTPIAKAGAWIPATIERFQSFQKAFVARDADAMWPQLDPTTQGAAEKIAVRIREFASKAADGDKTRLAATLDCKPESLATIAAKQILVCRPFLDDYAYLAAAKDPHPTMNGGKHLVLMNFTSGGKAYSVRIEAPSRKSLEGDNLSEKYKIVLPLPEVAVD
jgi:hypothetical protein